MQARVLSSKISDISLEIRRSAFKNKLAKPSHAERSSLEREIKEIQADIQKIHATEDKQAEELIKVRDLIEREVRNFEQLARAIRRQDIPYYLGVGGLSGLIVAKMMAKDNIDFGQRAYPYFCIAVLASTAVAYGQANGFFSTDAFEYYRELLINIKVELTHHPEPRTSIVLHL